MTDQTQHVLTAAEVAEIIGISPEAVVKRIRRGKLTAEKGEDGQWRLPWPQQRPGHTDQDRTDAGRQTGQRAGELLIMREMLDRQDREIAFLRDELQRKDMLIAESLRQQGELSKRLQALLPPDGPDKPDAPPDNQPDTPITSKPPSFWQRLWRGL